MTDTDLQDLRRSAASLLLYQEILVHPLAQAGLDLIEAVANRRSEVEILTAYGHLFLQMAKAGMGWRSCLVQQIRQAENPFSRAAARTELDSIPAPLGQAASHDLACLERLATAVERLRPELQARGVTVEWEDLQGWPWRGQGAVGELAHWYRQQGVGIWGRYRAFRWQQGIQGIEYPDPIRLEELQGYDRQKQQLCANTEALIRGGSSLHVLLYGARGTGKSSLVKAMVNRYADRGLRLVEVSRADLVHLPQILEVLRGRPHPFILFVDDLSFEADETEFKQLKVLLEGDIAAQPPHVRLYATTNRRHLIREMVADRPNPAQEEVHAWDTVQEKLSLGDRFGLTLTFQPFNQREYLATVEHLLYQSSVPGDPQEIRRQALLWAQAQNGFSGRTARQFVDSLQAGLIRLAAEEGR